MKTTKKTNCLAAAILEMADDQHSLGIMADEAFKKVTVRHGRKPPMTAEPARASRNRPKSGIGRTGR